MNKMLENLSPEQLEELEEAKKIGRGLIKGIDRALKMASGEIPLPKKSIWEKLEEWKAMAEEVESNDIA